MLIDQFKSHSSAFPALAEVTEKELGLYEAHFRILSNWNERMALVSKKSIDKSFATHYVDSIMISDFAEKHRQGRDVYDLGTGAGFPGIVYAIRYPQVKVSIFERSLKKQTFLSAALATLDLPNIMLGGEFPNKKMTGLFLARAVLPPAELFPFMSKRMIEGSTLILNVGGQSEEIQHPSQFKRKNTEVYDLPLDAGSRRVESFDFVPRGTI